MSILLQLNQLSLLWGWPTRRWPSLCYLQASSFNSISGWGSKDPRKSSCKEGKAGKGDWSLLHWHFILQDLRIKCHHIFLDQVMESKKSTKVKKAKQLRLVKGQSNRRSQGQIKRTNSFKKAKEEVKSFQGVSTSSEKPKKRKVNKTEKRNKILAQKLAA